MVERQRAADRRRQLRRRGPRHRHRRQPRLAAEGLPHRLRRGARAPPRDADRRGRRARVLAAQRDRDARDTEREHGALRAADDAVELDTTGLDARRGRRREIAEPRPRAGDSPEGRTLPTVAIVGFPNVGKSTLVNRLAGGREAVTACRGRGHPRPQAARVRVERRRLRPDRHRRHRPRGRSRAGPRHPAPGAARRSPRPTRSLLVVDGQRRPAVRRRRAGPDRCVGAGVPVLVAVNKVRPSRRRVTSPPSSTRSASASRSPVSATHGLGTGDLLDAIVEALGDRPPRADEDDDAVRIAVIGRPNVGKSSLVNALPRRRPGDRLRHRRHHPRRDRHRARGRRAASHPGRHRRPAAPRPRSPARSTTTPSCAPSGRSSAPTSRSSSATPPRASPPRTCGSARWR